MHNSISDNCLHTTKVLYIHFRNKLYSTCVNCNSLLLEPTIECCNNPKYIYFRFKQVDGNPMSKQVCMNCGTTKGVKDDKSYSTDKSLYNRIKIMTTTIMKNLSSMKKMRKSILITEKKNLSKAIIEKKIRKDNKKVKVRKPRKKGITPKRQKFYNEMNNYYKTKDWYDKRMLVIERENGICEKCKKSGNVIHHKTYVNFKNEKLDDLMCLCKYCHDKIHNFKHNKGL